MVTPSVQREVRRHFNCASLEGAELEDQVLPRIENRKCYA